MKAKFYALTEGERRTLRAAIESAIQNEEEFVRCHYDSVGKCMDPATVRKTKRFVERMKKVSGKLRAS